MRQKFAINQDLDLLTPHELTVATSKVIEAVVGLREPPTIISHTYPFASDAAGLVGAGSANNAECEVWRCPQGMQAALTRITLDIAGFPATVVNTTGRLALRRDDTAGGLVYFWPQPGGNVAPSLDSYGGTSAPWLKGGQRLVLVGAAMSASTSFTLLLQIAQWETPGLALKGKAGGLA